MPGIDRVGPGAPKTPSKAVSALQTDSFPTKEGGPTADPTLGDLAADSLGPTARGKESNLLASAELPSIFEQPELPFAVVTGNSKTIPCSATLLDHGLPLGGSSGYRRFAERMLTQGVAGVETLLGPENRRLPVGLEGEALAKLRIKLQVGDDSRIVKLADLGIVGIRFG